MDRAKMLAAATMLAALAGCGKGGVEARNASIAEVAKQAAGQIAFQPGEWESAVRIVSVDVPGDPNNPMVAAMRGNMAKAAQTSRHCMTPEEAKSPTAKMFTGDAADACRYDRFSMAGGTMDAVLACKGAGGRPGMKMAMAGRYTATSFDMTSTMDMPNFADPKGAAMTIKTEVAGKRVGECAAAAKKPS